MCDCKAVCDCKAKVKRVEIKSIGGHRWIWQCPHPSYCEEGGKRRGGYIGWTATLRDAVQHMREHRYVSDPHE